MRRLEDRPWWPDLVALKDVLSLRELASRYGVNPAAVANALKRSGLTREPSPPGPRVARSQERQAKAAEALARAGEPPTVQAPAVQPEKGPATVQASPPPDTGLAIYLVLAGLKAELADLKAELASLKAACLQGQDHLWRETQELRAALPSAAALEIQLGPWEKSPRGDCEHRSVLGLLPQISIASSDGFRVVHGCAGEIRGEAAGLDAAKAAADAAATRLGYVLNESTLPEEAPGDGPEEAPGEAMDR